MARSSIDVNFPFPTPIIISVSSPRQTRLLLHFDFTCLCLHNVGDLFLVVYAFDGCGRLLRRRGWFLRQIGTVVKVLPPLIRVHAIRWFLRWT